MQNSETRERLGARSKTQGEFEEIRGQPPERDGVTKNGTRAVFAQKRGFQGWFQRYC